MRWFGYWIGVVLINLAVLVVLLGSAEIYFRLHGDEQAPVPKGQREAFRPYVMFATKPGPYSAWTNKLTGERIASSVTTNSLGFNDPHEFNYTQAYDKKPDEKVVLFTGGSAAWGVGASATDKTVAGRMQDHLNRLQSKIRYTVIDIAMAGYIAYQQFLAMSLWGESFHPDWVVSMDGFNDADIGCDFSQGVGNPIYFAAMNAYVTAYMFDAQRPVFYRGWLENQIIKYSAAYRALTGKEYLPNPLILAGRTDESTTARLAITPTKIGAARDIEAFYLKGERAMLGLFPHAKYILSTQPMVNDFHGDFVDIYDFPMNSDAHRKAATARQATLEQYLTQYQDQPCGGERAKVSFTYVYVNGAIELEKLADARHGLGDDVRYLNAGAEFPDARDERKPFFIDAVHLSDKGMDRLGLSYAQKILAADNGQ